MKHLTSARILAAAVAALSVVSSLADKTTNTYTRTSSASADITWSTAGLPSTVTTTTGSDISIKIDYAEGGEKYQRIKTATLPIYLDSVIGGKYHNLSFVHSAGNRYAVINDPTTFEGFWSIDANPARACGIYLPDNEGAGVRTIGSAFLKGRFQFGVATGCEAILDYPFGLGMFEVNRSANMTPASLSLKGKLTINRSPGPYSVAQVRTGTLEIIGGDDDVSAPVPGAWARFDASVEDSFTFENETGITQWRDADGRDVSASVESSGANRPQRVVDAVTGKTLVDFGFRSGIADTARGGSRLKFPETVSGVGELFMVFREKSDVGTPLSFFSKAFPRHGTSNYLFQAWSSLPKELAMGEFRLNGQAVVPDVAYNFSRALNVVSAGYRSGGGDVLYFGSEKTATVNSDSAGGDAIAEVILYTNTLTAAQRRHNNEYLMRKWKGVGIRDYGAIMLAKDASLSVESGTVRVRELQLATNGFVKAGTGNLEIESLNTNLNSLVVNGGAVRFVNTLERGANPQPAANPFAWFDAADSTSLDTFSSNYTGNAGTLVGTNYTFITSWRDKRNNGYSLHAPELGYANYEIYPKEGESDRPAWATLDESTGAHPMVDLGPWVCPCASPYKGNFGWINGISGLSTWLTLFKGASPYTTAVTRQGFVVFYKTHKNANPINSHEWSLRNAGNGNPASMFLADSYAGVGPLGGHWTYDGSTINPASISLPADKKTHLGSFMFADAACPVDVFGSDQNGGNSAGGCKIAEVILYDRVLTEQERLDTERYLMSKWNCGTHPADRSISSVGTLSFGAGVEAAIDTDSDMTYGKLVREDDGAVVKKGAGNATVAMFDPNAHDVTAVTVEGGSLSLSCDPLVDAWAHLDATRADSVEYETVNGTNFVTRWKDISGHGNDAANPAVQVSPKEKPVYRTVHLDGDNILADSGREIPVIDFGEYYNCEQLPGMSPTYPTNTASGLTFPDKYVMLQEFYVVHADTDYWLGDGAGHNNNYCGILGFCGSGGPDGTQFPFLRSSQTPVISGNGNNLIRGGYIGVNGEQTNGNYSPTLKQLNAYTVSAAGQVSNKWCLAHRGFNQWGGQVLGEVILFREANTVERRNAITAMLCNTWRAQGMPISSSWTLGSVSVANDASLTVNASDGFAYTATSLGGNGSISSACPILGVQNLAVGSEGVAGTLAVAADVTLEDNAVLDVYIDEEGHVGTVAMTGKLTVGGAATVRVHIPEGVRPEFGEYDLITATQITGYSGDWTAQVVEGSLRGTVSIGYDAQNNKIRLNIRPTGTIVILM